LKAIVKVNDDLKEAYPLQYVFFYKKWRIRG